MKINCQLLSELCKVRHLICKDWSKWVRRRKKLNSRQRKIIKILRLNQFLKSKKKKR